MLLMLLKLSDLPEDRFNAIKGFVVYPKFLTDNEVRKVFLQIIKVDSPDLLKIA